MTTSDLDEAIAHLAVVETAKASGPAERLRSEHVDSWLVDLIAVSSMSVAVAISEAVVHSVAILEAITAAVARTIETTADDLDLPTTACTASGHVTVGKWLRTTCGTIVATWLRIIRTNDLACNATAVRRGLDTRKYRTNRISQAFTRLEISVLKSSLNDVVGERIPQHLLELIADQHLINKKALGLVISSAQTLLDHVGAELLLGQSNDATAEVLAERRGEAAFVEIEDVLDNIVAEGILDEVEGTPSDASNELGSLGTLGVVDAALQDTTTVSMSANNDTLGCNSIIDELGPLSTKTRQALLNDVVAIEILDKLDDGMTQGVNDHVNLLIGLNVFDHLLQSPSSMLIVGNDRQRWRCGVDQSAALNLITMLEQLLTKIVAERVSHELNNMRARLREDDLNRISIAIFELALKVATAVLILAKLVEAATIRL